MEKHIIKFRYGLTVDENRQRTEPCPYCGGVVCHVKENEDEVFCMNLVCKFHSFVDNSHYKWLKERFAEDARSGHVWFDVNSRYPTYSHPFIHRNDIACHKYIIRDFLYDEDEWLCRYKPLRLTKIACVKYNSPIIAQYASLDLMFEDGWINNYENRRRIEND